MSRLSITYKCCGRTYTLPTELFGGAAATVPHLDRLHAIENLYCPPLEAPMNTTLTGGQQ